MADTNSQDNVEQSSSPKISDDEAVSAVSQPEVSTQNPGADAEISIAADPSSEPVDNEDIATEPVDVESTLATEPVDSEEPAVGPVDSVEPASEEHITEEGKLRNSSDDDAARDDADESRKYSDDIQEDERKVTPSPSQLTLPDSRRSSFCVENSDLGELACRNSSGDVLASTSSISTESSRTKDVEEVVDFSFMTGSTVLDSSVVKSRLQSARTPLRRRRPSRQHRISQSETSSDIWTISEPDPASDGEGEEEEEEEEEEEAGSASLGASTSKQFNPVKSGGMGFRLPMMPLASVVPKSITKVSQMGVPAARSDIAPGHIRHLPALSRRRSLTETTAGGDSQADTNGPQRDAISPMAKLRKTPGPTQHCRSEAASAVGEDSHADTISPLAKLRKSPGPTQHCKLEATTEGESSKADSDTAQTDTISPLASLRKTSGPMQRCRSKSTVEEPACTKLQDESGCITVTNARAFFAAKQSDGSVPGTVGVRRGKYDRSESGPSDTLRTTAPRNEFELIPVRPRSYSALPAVNRPSRVLTPSVGPIGPGMLRKTGLLDSGGNLMKTSSSDTDSTAGGEDSRMSPVKASPSPGSSRRPSTFEGFASSCPAATSILSSTDGSETLSSVKGSSTATPVKSSKAITPDKSSPTQADDSSTLTPSRPPAATKEEGVKSPPTAPRKDMTDRPPDQQGGQQTDKLNVPEGSGCKSANKANHGKRRQSKKDDEPCSRSPSPSISRAFRSFRRARKSNVSVADTKDIEALLPADQQDCTSDLLISKSEGRRGSPSLVNSEDTVASPKSVRQGVTLPEEEPKPPSPSSSREMGGSFRSYTMPEGSTVDEKPVPSKSSGKSVGRKFKSLRRGKKPPSDSLVTKETKTERSEPKAKESKAEYSEVKDSGSPSVRRKSFLKYLPKKANGKVKSPSSTSSQFHVENVEQNNGEDAASKDRPSIAGSDTESVNHPGNGANSKAKSQPSSPATQSRCTNFSKAASTVKTDVNKKSSTSRLHRHFSLRSSSSTGSARKRQLSSNSSADDTAIDHDDATSQYFASAPLRDSANAHEAISGKTSGSSLVQFASKTLKDATKRAVSITSLSSTKSAGSAVDRKRSATSLSSVLSKGTAIMSKRLSLDRHAFEEPKYCGGSQLSLISGKVSSPLSPASEE